MVGGKASTRSARSAGGVLLVVGTLQYLVAEVVVASAWRPTYDWWQNPISDLGIITCGRLLHRGPLVAACSPLHGVMNLAFVVSGLLTVAGTILTWSWWPGGRLRDIAQCLWIAVGALKAVVGAVPEDTVIAVHLLGALNLPLSSVAILLLGLASRRTHPATARLSLVLAVVGLLGSAALLGVGVTSSLGLGGTERMIDLAADVWAVAVGLIVIRTSRRRKLLAGFGAS